MECDMKMGGESVIWRLYSPKYRHYRKATEFSKKCEKVCEKQSES